jgi:hypothetical protein
MDSIGLISQYKGLHGRTITVLKTCAIYNGAGVPIVHLIFVKRTLNIMRLACYIWTNNLNYKAFRHEIRSDGPEVGS